MDNEPFKRSGYKPKPKGLKDKPPIPPPPPPKKYQPYYPCGQDLQVENGIVSTIPERPFLNIIDLPPIKVTGSPPTPITGNLKRSGGMFNNSSEHGFFCTGIAKTPVKKDEPAYPEYYDAIDLNEPLPDPEESTPIPPKNFTIKEPNTPKKDPVDLKLLVGSVSINKDDCCVKALHELLDKYNDQYYWKPKEELYQIKSTKGAGIKCTPSNGIPLPFLITHDKDIKEVESCKCVTEEPEPDNLDSDESNMDCENDNE